LESRTLNNLTDYINENEIDDRNGRKFFNCFLDLDKTYNTNYGNMNKDSQGSLNNSNRNRNTYYNDGINYPKKPNGFKNEINGESVIKNLRSKIQRQEIDIKFLNEKLKKMQNDKSDDNLENSNISKKDSKLTSREVINIYN